MKSNHGRSLVFLLWRLRQDDGALHELSFVGAISLLSVFENLDLRYAGCESVTVDLFFFALYFVVAQLKVDENQGTSECVFQVTRINEFVLRVVRRNRSSSPRIYNVFPVFSVSVRNRIADREIFAVFSCLVNIRDYRVLNRGNNFFTIIFSLLTKKKRKKME